MASATIHLVETSTSRIDASCVYAVLLVQKVGTAIEYAVTARYPVYEQLQPCPLTITAQQHTVVHSMLSNLRSATF